jgi:hypothetical protein
MGLPRVEDAGRVGRRLDWEPRDAVGKALEKVEEEVEKRALVRFTVFTALRERRVTPREVSIVLGSDDNDRTGKCVDMRWRCERKRSEHCDTNSMFRHRFNSDNTRLNPPAPTNRAGDLQWGRWQAVSGE